jgi:hypothetical protein
MCNNAAHTAGTMLLHANIFSAGSHHQLLQQLGTAVPLNYAAPFLLTECNSSFCGVLTDQQRLQPLHNAQYQQRSSSTFWSMLPALACWCLHFSCCPASCTAAACSQCSSMQ